LRTLIISWLIGFLVVAVAGLRRPSDDFLPLTIFYASYGVLGVSIARLSEARRNINWIRELRDTPRTGTLSDKQGPIL